MHDAKNVGLSKVQVGDTILVTPERETNGDGMRRGFGRPKDSAAIPLTITAKDHVPDTWSGKVWTLTLADGSKTEGRYGTTHVYVVEAPEVRATVRPGPQVELDLGEDSTRRVLVDPDGTMHVEGWTGGDGEFTTPKGRVVHITADGILTLIHDFPEGTENPATMRPAVTEQEVLNSDRCDKCKGFGVVRKAGANAGRHYKTLKGSEEATVKGNSTTCPTCKGATLLVRSA